MLDGESAIKINSTVQQHAQAKTSKNNTKSRCCITNTTTEWIMWTCRSTIWQTHQWSHSRSCVMRRQEIKNKLKKIKWKGDMSKLKTRHHWRLTAHWAKQSQAHSQITWKGEKKIYILKKKIKKNTSTSPSSSSTRPSFTWHSICSCLHSVSSSLARFLNIWVSQCSCLLWARRGDRRLWEGGMEGGESLEGVRPHDTAKETLERPGPSPPSRRRSCISMVPAYVIMLMWHKEVLVLNLKGHFILNVPKQFLKIHTWCTDTAAQEPTHTDGTLFSAGRSVIGWEVQTTCVNTTIMVESC